MKIGTGAKSALGTATAAALALTLAGCGATTPGDDPSGAAPFYEGKTIEIIVPSAAGAGNDVTARWLAPLLAKYIPGNPKVQVLNVDGAGGRTAGNQFAEAEADGLTLMLSGEANTSHWMLKTENMNYDYAEWQALIGMPLGSVTFMRPGVPGVEEATDILDAEQTLILGGEENSGTITRALTLDLLDADFRVVTGYGGNAGEIALQQGEIDISGGSTSGYLSNTAPLVDQGLVIPLFSAGYIDDGGAFVRDPAVPDLPNIAEFYEGLHGQAPSGEKWDAYEMIFNATRALTQIVWVQQDAPEEARAALAEGVSALVEDPAYASGIDEFLGGYEPVTGDALGELVEQMSSPDPGTIAWLQDYVKQLFANV